MTEFCTNCGARLADGAKFCVSCGAQTARPAETIQPPPAQPAWRLPVMPPQPAVTVSREQQSQPAQHPQAQQPPYFQQPPQQIPQLQYGQPAPMAPKKRMRKAPFLIGGGALAAAALVLVLIFTNVFGLLNKTPDGGGNAEGNAAADGVTTYEIFGDGDLIKKPERLRAQASASDGISAAALTGPWQGVRSSINTEYGFGDDGYFYKNTMITNTHITSTYHPGYWSYGSYYDTYHYGWTEYGFSYSYTYLDTLIGEYRVRGGVIEFFHVVAISHISFDDDWYKKDTRSVSIEQVQRESQNAKMQDDFSVEFEFINPTRVRFRDESLDIDLFWHISDDPHNVQIPSHEIPAVEWPKRALSPDMPEFKTKGRIREASLSYSGGDPNIKAEFKTVTVVIDKADALSEINVYGSVLKSAGWWVEDYQLGSEDTYLSFEARKGMFKLKISNGRGSGTSADTIVIESTKYSEGRWPAAWSAAGLEPPDNAVIVGDIKAEKDDNKNIYENLIFDRVDDNGVTAYMDKLVKAGFKKPQYSYNDWDMMKYIRIDGDLYLARVQLDKRMDNLSAFTCDLTYVPDGVWPESWKNGGLPAPEGYETIAGAIDAEEWGKSITEYAYANEYIKYLGLDAGETDAYFNKLKASGFRQVKNDWDDSVRLYNYLRIDGKMLRIEVRPMDNEDIAEISYSFNYYEDGVWPKTWKDGGLPAPEGFGSIIGAIDTAEWGKNIADYGRDSVYIKFLGLDAGKADAYLNKLKASGFRQVKDDWDDSVRLYNYLRIDGKMLRVEVRPVENDELTEFSYSFEYYEDGVWPKIWQDGGLPAPEGFGSIIGAIDTAEWGKNIADYGRDNVYVKFLGMDAGKAERYLSKLQSMGFRDIKSDWDDYSRLCNYLRIDGGLYRVEICPAENDELIEFSYSFEYYEDGEWPSQWASAGIPAPAFTAMAGRIDTAEWTRDLSDYGSYGTYIKLPGANLATYAETLRKNGFTAPEYSWSDTWELSKRVQLAGKWVIVTIEDTGNKEIPEISIRIRNE